MTGAWSTVGFRSGAIQHKQCAIGVLVAQRFHGRILVRLQKTPGTLDVRKLHNDHSRRAPQIGLKDQHLATARSLDPTVFFSYRAGETLVFLVGFGIPDFRIDNNERAQDSPLELTQSSTATLYPFARQHPAVNSGQSERLQGKDAGMRDDNYPTHDGLPAGFPGVVQDDPVNQTPLATGKPVKTRIKSTDIRKVTSGQ